MRTEPTTTPRAGDRLASTVVLFLSLAAAIGTSTIYPLQPAIADVANSLGAQVAAVGLALACGPAGYMAGLGLLVPLVDRFPPGRVLAIQFAVMSGTLAACAAVGDVWSLGLPTEVSVRPPGQRLSTGSAGPQRLRSPRQPSGSPA